MENKKMFELTEKEGVIYLNPQIYPLEIIYKAAYVMLEKAFIMLDSDGERIKVVINKKKDDQNVKLLIEEFNEELLNYSVYKIQNEKNKIIRELILQKVMIANDPAYQSAFNRTVAGMQEKKAGVNDTKGILKRWEDRDG